MLQRGHGGFGRDRHEKRVRLARNKIKTLTDSNESSPRVSAKERGTESVGKRDNR
jgi:hypothetical protein